MTKYIGLCAVLLACGESDEERAKRYAREAEVSAAAELLCTKGTPNAKAGAPVNGKRPIMQVIERDKEREYGKMWIPTHWEGLPQPKRLEDLLLVACRAENKTFATSCRYTSGYTINKYKQTDVIRVLDAKTGEKLGEQAFEGGLPSENCDGEITHSGTSMSKDVTGMNPDRHAETAWLKTFVDKP